MFVGHAFVNRIEWAMSVWKKQEMIDIVREGD